MDLLDIRYQKNVTEVVFYIAFYINKLAFGFHEILEHVFYFCVIGIHGLFGNKIVDGSAW